MKFSTSLLKRSKVYVISLSFLAVFIFSGVTAQAASSSTFVLPTPSLHHLGTSSVDPIVTPLSPSFNPQTGGVPFCSSSTLVSILCYAPNFLKVAYNFPAANQPRGYQGPYQRGYQNNGFLDGTGSTVVIVDAFGSPTIQSDLNKFDAAFNLPATTVTVLCGPTWTGSQGDNCPIKSVADLYTSPATGSNAYYCGGVPGMVGWAEETTLDVTQVHALAPGARIVLVVANDCFDSSIYSAELAVVNQHHYRGSIMTQSFGEPDNMVTCTAVDPNTGACTARNPSLLDLPNQVFESAARNQWTVLASSGDWGATTDAGVVGTLELTPSFPATNPLVLAVGGTQGNPYAGQYGSQFPGGTFTCAAHRNCNTGLVIINGGASGCTTSSRPGEPTSCVPVGYGGESAWNEFTQLGEFGTVTGGGVSSLYPRPFYQHGLPDSFTTLLGSTVSASGRLTPDVSFNSAVNGGVLAWLGFLLNQNGNPAPLWAVFGGTSAASPAWAAIIALLNQANGRSVGFINPIIYELASSHQYHQAFHDVTSGDNSLSNGITLNCGTSSSPIPCTPDGFVAGPGYDLTTGWGTPNVANLINALSQNIQGDQGR
jgi:subtilase family serine protease